MKLGKRGSMYKLLLSLLGCLCGGYCIYTSGFSFIEKTILAVCTLLGCASALFSKRWAARIYGAALISISMIGLCYNCIPYGQYRWYNSNATNKFTQNQFTQLSYSAGTGNSDTILPLLLRDKQVCIDAGSPYLEYVKFFSKGLAEDVPEEISYQVSTEDAEHMKSSYLYVGRMSISILDFLFSQKDHDAITDLIVKEKKSPVLYFENAEIADKAVLKITSDEDYNLYVSAYIQ